MVVVHIRFVCLLLKLSMSESVRLHRKRVSIQSSSHVKKRIRLGDLDVRASTLAVRIECRPVGNFFPRQPSKRLGPLPLSGDKMKRVHEEPSRWDFLSVFLEGPLFEHLNQYGGYRQSQWQGLRPQPPAGGVMPNFLKDKERVG